MYSPFASVNHLFFSSALSNFSSFEDEVRSPENAVVLEVCNEHLSRKGFNFFIDLFRAKPQSPTDKASWGNYIMLEFSDGKVLVLKHLDRVEDWAAGQQVSKGDLLAYVGASGMCHLPGLGLLCFSNRSLDNLEQICFLGCVDKQGEAQDLYYLTQGKSFRFE